MGSNIKKGLIFGILGNILVGFQPIVANSRPESIDAYIFAAMTCLVEATIFIPLMLIELKLNRLKARNSNILINTHDSILKNWKKNLKVLLFIGLLFSINQLLFFIGYKLAGAINGALTQKTTVFFGLIFGYLILKEKITIVQIIFSIILFFGLVIAITQFSFNLENINLDLILGILTLLVITCLWMLGHTITKPIFSRNEVTPTQMVFIRNILSGSILFSTYFIFFPLQNLSVFLDPINNFYFFLMGTVYGLGLFCWYKTLSYLDVSKATILFSSTPIVTAVFATFILGEIFTIFHIIGTIIIIISIILIMRLKRN
ncbi:MAG: DMT family transporter [Candidatus Odinarchaeota archaeon]